MFDGSGRPPPCGSDACREGALQRDTFAGHSQTGSLRNPSRLTPLPQERAMQRTHAKQTSVGATEGDSALTPAARCRAANTDWDGFSVIPAKAGVQQYKFFHWVPACAGTTKRFSNQTFIGCWSNFSITPGTRRHWHGCGWCVPGPSAAWMPISSVQGGIHSGSRKAVPAPTLPRIIEKLHV
jgi:hypothetical protein